MSPEDSSSKSGGIEIAIARHIEAPPEQVFDAWLDQGSVGRWLFATPGGVMKRVSTEPHVGGGFVISEDREGQVAEHVGTYLEIDRPRRLAFEFAADPNEKPVRVTVVFVPEAGATDVTLTQEVPAKWVEFAERGREGWTAILAGLARVVETAQSKALNPQRKEPAMSINPYIFYDGNCEEAFKFYERALGGKILMMLPHSETPAADHVPKEWGPKIIHARMKIGDVYLMASDAPPGHFKKPQGFSVNISVDTPAEAERVFTALSEGGSINMPIGSTFFAERFGMLVDRFGIPWMINCEKPV